MTPSDKLKSPYIPAFQSIHALTLATRHCALLRAILVAESATTGCEDDIGVAQILEECWQTEGVHATGDDWCRLDHSLPLLMKVRAVGLIILQHECNTLVRRVTLHFAEAHGANMDAAGTNDTGNLGVHKGSVATLSLGTGDGTMARTVVVEELLGEISARNCHCSATGNIAIHKEGAVLR